MKASTALSWAVWLFVIGLVIGILGILLSGNIYTPGTCGFVFLMPAGIIFFILYLILHATEQRRDAPLQGQRQSQKASPTIEQATYSSQPASSDNEGVIFCPFCSGVNPSNRLNCYHCQASLIPFRNFIKSKQEQSLPPQQSSSSGGGLFIPRPFNEQNRPDER